ncbi:hypothetical protein RZR97_07190 [Hydrogenimonas thermophila]|uniref:hypothetical protein n=1 Tax=Hydrogenimonas thermophila TaxID=223786 RepID=UPI0029373F4A|nr:hypothetical protein [Hydrogenimonas thermophila]WOE68898.1 hypothetical protein RZR91_07220 [Hydrogenimonas thermophila]WOE71406.1 hypothetical protein RZR97_07190 [Hydrogenimonas thermophila]
MANNLLKNQSIPSFEYDKRLYKTAAKLYKIFSKHFLNMNALSLEYWFENLDDIENGFYGYLEQEKDKRPAGRTSISLNSIICNK